MLTSRSLRGIARHTGKHVDASHMALHVFISSDVQGEELPALSFRWNRLRLVEPSGALIWTLVEKVGQDSGGHDWEVPRLTLVPPNHGGQGLCRPFR